MNLPNRSKAIPRALLSLGFLASMTALAGLGGLSACKPVDISDPPADTSATAKDSAQISISNFIEQDPDSLTFLLYPSTTVDLVNASTPAMIGTVAADATRRFKVPAGTWKLAYEDRGGTIIPMEDVNAANGVWLKSVFVKNGDYALIVKTEVDQTVWVPNYTTIPKIE